MTPTEQKALLDAIARAAFGWPDDGTRRTYAPADLPDVIMRLRHHAQKALTAEPQGAPLDPPHVVRAKANAAAILKQDGWCRKCGWDSKDPRCPTEHPSTCDGVY